MTRNHGLNPGGSEESCAEGHFRIKTVDWPFLYLLPPFSQSTLPLLLCSTYSYYSLLALFKHHVIGYDFCMMCLKKLISHDSLPTWMNTY